MNDQFKELISKAFQPYVILISENSHNENKEVDIPVYNIKTNNYNVKYKISYNKIENISIENELFKYLNDNTNIISIFYKEDMEFKNSILNVIFNLLIKQGSFSLNNKIIIKYNDNLTEEEIQTILNEYQKDIKNNLLQLLKPMNFLKRSFGTSETADLYFKLQNYQSARKYNLSKKKTIFTNIILEDKNLYLEDIKIFEKGSLELFILLLHGYKIKDIPFIYHTINYILSNEHPVLSSILNLQLAFTLLENNTQYRKILFIIYSSALVFYNLSLFNCSFNILYYFLDFILDLELKDKKTIFKLFCDICNRIKIQNIDYNFNDRIIIHSDLFLKDNILDINYLIIIKEIVNKKITIKDLETLSFKIDCNTNIKEFLDINNIYFIFTDNKEYILNKDNEYKIEDYKVYIKVSDKIEILDENNEIKSFKIILNESEFEFILKI